MALIRPQPACAQEAASAAQDLTLQDVVFTFGETRVTVPNLVISGTRLSKDDVLAILKSDGPEPASTRFGRLDAGSLSAPEVRLERTDGTTNNTAIYRNVVAKNVHGGRVAELTSESATIERTGPHVAHGRYGVIRGEDIDLVGVARLYQEPGDGKGPLLPIYGPYSASDIVAEAEGTTISIASLKGSRFAARQVPGTWNGLETAFEGLSDDTDGPGERATKLGLIADLLEGVSFGDVEVNGIAVKTTAPAAAELRLAKLAYAESGEAPGVSLSDFSFSGGGMRLQVSGSKLNGYSLAPTIATLRRIAAEPGNAEAEFRRLTPLIGTLAMNGVSIDIDDEAAKPKAAPKASGDPLGANSGNTSLHIGLREGTLSFGPPQDGVPTAGQLNLSGLTLPSSAVAGIPGLGSLGLYGYRDLDLKLVADTVWNEDSKELALREISVSGKDMGTLRIHATLGGIGPDVFDPDAAVSGFAMLATTAKALDLTLENGGLFERFIDAQAKTLSLKPDELRKEYVTASVIGVPVILGNSAAAKAIGAAMGKFVAKPGTLSIRAKAKNGAGLGVVDFSTAATPGAVLDKLEVNATAD